MDAVNDLSTGIRTSPEVADEDLALVDASASGDVAAFEELVRRYDRKLLRIAQRMTHSLEDAEEVVQDAFLKAYFALSRFERKSKFSTWLIRIVTNECLMKLRKRRRYAAEISLEAPDGEHLPMDLADWAPNPEQLYARSELREILHEALEQLRPALRVVFVLRDVEGLSIADTAAVLKLREAAVKARLLRARLQLREKLASHFRQPASAQAQSSS
jgi:RNA polymerase sigma-70 factor (ECF subfamily)